MPLKLNTKITLGFVVAVSVLLLTSVVSWLSMQQLGYYTQRVEHTYQVLQLTSDLRMRMRDAQTLVRGYLLLRDSSYLTEYPASIAQARLDLRQLRQLTRDNPLQQARLDSLGQVMNVEIATLRHWQRQAPSPAAVRNLVRTGEPNQLLLRRLVERTKRHEEYLLKQRRQGQNFFETTTPVAIVVSAVLATVLVLWLLTRISRELKANAALQQELAQTNAGVARRIQIIEQLAERVVQGDYSVKIRDEEQDSLGNLAASLNHMTQTLEDNFSALESRNRELDQFAYVASHDLKAPLRGVLTVVKWIEDELPHELSEQMRQYLNLIKGRLHRLEDLINGLLAYARAGRTDHKLEEVDVHQLVREVADLVLPASFRLHTPTPLPRFSTDRLSLQQVFTNLLSNAAKYHHRPAEGCIVVGCRELDDCYEFRVEDNGPGIAPQFHHKIFLMFQTLRDRHSAESTGIGLSIVKRIVEEHKGTVWVESAEGAGAAFLFTWPKSDAGRL